MKFLDLVKDYGSLVNIGLAFTIIAMIFRFASLWKEAASKEFDAKLAGKASELEASRATLAAKNAELEASKANNAEKNVELEGANSKLRVLESQVQSMTQIYEARITLLKERDEIVPRVGKNKDVALSGSNRAEPTESTELYDRIYLAGEAVDFYNEVAPYYNARNTGRYGDSYDLIYDACASYFNELQDISICDLGGGTGYLLREFAKHDVWWLNIDLAGNALAVFESDFVPYSRKTSRIADVTRIGYIRPQEQFDAVFASFLLSSLNGEINWRYIRDAVKDGGLLVVADNHFSYTQRERYYGFNLSRVGKIGFQPRPMYSEQIISEITTCGFELKESKFVTLDDRRIYAQVHSFSPA